MNFRVLVVIFLICSTAAADPPKIESIPPGTDKIVVVKEGDKVPFSGQLFDAATALRWANWLQQYRTRLYADVVLEQTKSKVKVDYEQSLMKIEKDKNAIVQRDLRERLIRSEKARLDAEEEARNPPWYRTREFGLVVGVVATAAIVGVSVWALESRDK